MTELARIYGRSLYELASEENISEPVLTQLSACEKLLRENPDYVKLLSTPSISKEERRAALGKAFDGQVHTYVVSFMKILVDRESIGEFSGCVEAYRRRYYEDNNIMEVTVTTAVKLGKELEEKLLARLDTVFGKKILLKSVVDPAVLGGMCLECDGRRYDGTVKDRLDRIARGLRETVL